MVANFRASVAAFTMDTPIILANGYEFSFRNEGFQRGFSLRRHKTAEDQMNRFFTMHKVGWCNSMTKRRITMEGCAGNRHTSARLTI